MIHIPRDCREDFIPVNIPGASLAEEWGIELAGISDLTKGYIVDRRECPFTLLLCVLEGRGEYISKGETCDLVRGDIILMGEGADHLYRCAGSWSILWFHLSGNQWKEGGEPIWKTNRTDLTDSLYHLSLTYRNESQLEGSETVLPSLGEGLNSMIERVLSLSGAPSGHGHGRKLLLNLKKVIRENISRDWSVEELASQINISPSYLYKVVRKEERTTPLGLVKKLRMDLALQLLTRSDYPLKYIAERVGYATAYSFTKAFKKSFALSPGRYRREPEED